MTPPSTNCLCCRPKPMRAVATHFVSGANVRTSFASTEQAGTIKEITAHLPGFHTVAVSVQKGLIADIHSSVDNAFTMSGIRSTQRRW